MARETGRGLGKRLPLASLVAVIFAACALAPGAAVAGTLDQQQTDAGGPGVIVDTSQSVAQTFTAGFSGSLDQVDLYLGSYGGTPTAPLSIEIRDVSGAAPGFTVLTSSSVPAADVSAVGAFVPIAFATPASVVAGTQYAIVAYSSTSGAKSYVWVQGAADNPYAAGAPFFTANSPPAGPWAPDNPILDFAFKTYVVPSVVPSLTSPPSPAGPTGQRAAALKKCAKIKNKAKKKKCKKRARSLPV